MSELTTVVTIVHGRHDHLREQVRVLRTFSPESAHVVVAMDDPAIDEIVGQGRGTTVLHVEGDPLGLPLARARNVGVESALADGAGLVILLDVDCVPGPQLVTTYERAASWTREALLSGPVTYLDEGVDVPFDVSHLDRLRAPHPARPAPRAGELERGGDHNLFWSLNCAMTARTWRSLAGFHEGYVGYGAEDTDFGRAARARGIELVWVGGADAYHQFHPVSQPPVEHLPDIVRNAGTFHERWGEWPMPGWLEEFERRGLVTRDGGQLLIAPDPQCSQDHGGTVQP